MPDLIVNSLCAGYGRVQVLHDISLRIPSGRRVALMGSNGAGKTTLVKAINGLIKTRSGQISWDEHDVQLMQPYLRTRAGIATVAEGRMLFPDCSVEENLVAASSFGLAKAMRKKTVERVFSLFPRLRERYRQRAGSMSGGEQQMLAIARALMTLPHLLILDEPSIGLAPKVVAEIFAVLSQLSVDGLSLLLVEQNVQLSLRSVDYAYVIQQGRLVLSGAPDELMNNPHVQHAYLGQ